MVKRIASIQCALTAPLLALVIALIVTIAACGSPPPHEEHAAVSATQKQLWTCGMHPQVIQDHPGSCPICGMTLTPLKTDPAGAARGSERQVRYWWDPMMSPPYISTQPGKSPMGMDLIPVYADEVAGGATVTIEPAVVQNMGVRVATVTRGPLRTVIRAVGYLDEAEPNQHEINLRVSGWIEHLYANTEGMHLRQGDPLFDLYSPELHVAIEELIAARHNGPSPLSSDLSTTAERKLRLLGLTAEQIRQLSTRQQAPAAVTFTTPITGHLVEKTVIDGAAVKAGDRVLRIVDHSTLWLDAQIYEQQLPFVRLGQAASASVAAQPGVRFSGEIIFIHPHVDPMTRAAMVRIALANPGLTLRPNMYATVEITADLAGDALQVPREAVIDTGVRQIAFVALDGGRFEPRRVSIGAEGNDGMVQVLSGLAPDERVVTSGQFLLDAESRLREAIQKHLQKTLLQPPAHQH